MNLTTRCGFSLVALVCLALPAFGQEKTSITIPKVEMPSPPNRAAVAASVNNQPIHEIAVYRALIGIPADQHAEARMEILDFLVEKALIDQYLDALKVAVDAQEVEKKVAQLRKEFEDDKKDFGKFLESLHLSEQELRAEISGALKWDQFTDSQAPANVLEDMFNKNRIMFDGSLVRARHILVKPPENSAEGAKKAQAHALLLKKHIEGEVAKELAKVPPLADPLKKEEARAKALDKVFMDVAKQASECPSKEHGGELGWFPRLGKMVEPFSAAAFSLQPYQLSDPVATEFGFHLILTIDTKQGRDIKFEQVKPFVKEVFAERLREAVLQRMRPTAQIEVKKAP
jgi:peptidyl-prolyl cis-trans isomerase C